MLIYPRKKKHLDNRHIPNLHILLALMSDYYQLCYQHVASCIVNLVSFMFKIKKTGESQVGKNVFSVLSMFWLTAARIKRRETCQWRWSNEPSQLKQWTNDRTGFVSGKVCLLVVFYNIWHFLWKPIRSQNCSLCWFFAGSQDLAKSTN